MSEDPIKIFENWLTQAKNAGVIEPTAVNLATISKEGFPRNRMVLFKQIIDSSFVFFTNYNSSKAKEIENNNHVALCFYWEKLEKQIRIEGTATKTSSQVSDKYFKSRFKLSKLGASVSKQSSVLENYDEFLNAVKQLSKKYENEDEVPRPKHWGGFAVNPQKIEFWQQGEFRLHKRQVFEKQQNIWKTYNLYP